VQFSADEILSDDFYCLNSSIAGREFNTKGQRGKGRAFPKSIRLNEKMAYLC
jgi:hypothetical protein